MRPEPPPTGTLPVVASLRDLSKAYDNGTLALSGIDLDVRAGEFLCLLGPSGCGKSTILKLLAGLSTPTSGELQRPARHASDIGYVFQDPTLLPWSTVADNIALPLRLWRRPADEIGREVDRVLSMVGLDGFARAYPRELSGGMKMRVSIARALVTGPKLLLMDEPFAALDEITRAKLDDDLLDIHRSSGCTIVFVTHSTVESVYLATRIAVMRSRPGQIVGYVDVSGTASRDRAFRVSPDFVRRAAEVSGLLDRGSAY